MSQIKQAIECARSAYHDSTRWSEEECSDGTTYEDVIDAAIKQQDERIAELEAASSEHEVKKVSYIGVPAVFRLELACRHIEEAYGDSFGCYIVGSSLKKPNWRDVDVVLIMRDEDFRREFPKVHDITTGVFEFDTKWLLNSITLSTWLSEHTGLPIDFKIQPQTWANERHKGKTRHPIGLIFAPPAST